MHTLSTYGRVVIHYREEMWNTKPDLYEWLCDRLMFHLAEVSPSLGGNQAVVGLTLNPVLHTRISDGFWTKEGGFDAAVNDKGMGKHLTIHFWAYGDTEEEAFINLGQAFQGILEGCERLNADIHLGLTSGQNELDS